MTFELLSLRVARGLALATIGALLASCGGSEDVDFVPARVLSFGDESSIINADGSKYTVNGIVPGSGTPGTLDCTLNPIWNQVLATSYGLTFPQCPGSVPASTPSSRILAQPGQPRAERASATSRSRSRTSSRCRQPKAAASTPTIWRRC